MSCRDCIEVIVYSIVYETTSHESCRIYVEFPLKFMLPNINLLSEANRLGYLPAGSSQSIFLAFHPSPKKDLFFLLCKGRGTQPYGAITVDIQLCHKGLCLDPFVTHSGRLCDPPLGWPSIG